MARKGTPIDDSPIERWRSLLKKETLYNNITSLENYIELVEEWIEFYNTNRIKKKVDKKKGVNDTIIFIIISKSFGFNCHNSITFLINKKTNYF